MNTRTLLIALSAASALFTVSFAPPPLVGVEEKTEMETHMQAINKGTRSLRKMLGDAEQNDAALVLLAELEGHALAAKSLTPQRLAKVAEDDKIEFMLGFRSGMVALLSGMLEVELAVLEERQDDAIASLKNMLKLKNPSHKKFKIRKPKK